jgi:hypothetical protein
MLPFMEQERAVDYADADRKAANPSGYAATKPSRPAFPGPAYREEFDYERLTGQMAAVYRVMKDGRKRTIREVRDEVGKGSETGIAAAIRALRKPEYGSHRIEKERVGDPRSGLWAYYMIVEGEKA